MFSHLNRRKELLRSRESDPFRNPCNTRPSGCIVERTQEHVRFRCAQLETNEMLHLATARDLPFALVLYAMHNIDIHDIR